MTGYDVIGDVHGCAEALEALLRKLGYAERDGAWRHSGRQAIFVGDLIDRGDRQVETVEMVRRMVDAGSAQVVMGNHEFNAISWMTKNRDQRGQFMRVRDGEDGKHFKQHRAFLDQVTQGSKRHRTYIKWFRKLPLWLDLGGLRVVHACWHDESLRTLATVGGRLTNKFVVAANTKGSAEYNAIEVVLKGPEVHVSPPFLDKDDHERHHARIRWWTPEATTLRRMAEIPPGSVTPSRDPYPGLPDTPHDAADEYRYHHDVPVIFGHYWRTLDTLAASPKALCVDLSAVKRGHLAAYRWDGEPVLDIQSERFVMVPSLRV